MSVAPSVPQFIIMNTSTYGDPINCNAPGTYGAAGSPLANVYHPPVTGFDTATTINMGTASAMGAACSS